MNYDILQGDCIEQLRTMEANSVHTCVTSPPYYGLRDYGHDGQIGLEETPEAYVAKLVEVFREVRRVLRDDGTVWLNLGDSYFSSTKGTGGSDPEKSSKQAWKGSDNGQGGYNVKLSAGGLPIKPKDLIGIPWRVAFALQADGWYLRQDIIWHKPNPMPESVTDRCTKAHEYIFLLSKSERYYYDIDAMKEKAVKGDSGAGARNYTGINGRERLTQSESSRIEGRNRRSVWTIATQPYPGAHFAAFPPELIRPCIQAGCPPDGLVLDPFGGSGTTAQVAIQEGRNAVIIELNPKYVELARKRIVGTQMPLLKPTS
jgi:DNA modification methylase